MSGDALPVKNQSPAKKLSESSKPLWIKIKTAPGWSAVHELIQTDHSKLTGAAVPDFDFIQAS